MKVFRKLEEDICFSNAVVTIGMFDGVHCGHNSVLEQLNETAKEIGGESVVVTFWPHPRKVLGKGNGLEYLTSLEEKIDLIGNCGIDNLIILPFDKELYNLTTQEFIENILHRSLLTHTLLIGYNNRIGKGREGTFEVVSKIAASFGIVVKQLLPVKKESVGVSSSIIREKILSGNIAEANIFLGYPYKITGTVIFGEKVGRKIGFPTANIAVENKEKLLPKVGVYAVSVIFEGKKHQGMLNIGYRPTMGSLSLKTIEVNIFNFQKEIYNKQLTVNFHYKLRDEKKFETIEKLVNQLKDDREKSLKLLKDI